MKMRQCVECVLLFRVPSGNVPLRDACEEH